MKRFIRYLYEYEQGRRTRNVGFVKVEQGEDVCTVHIHGKGLKLSGEQELSLYLFYEESGVCVGIWQGDAGNIQPALNYRLSYTPEDTGVPENFGRIEGIILKSKQNKSYAAVWDDMPVDVENMRIWQPEEEAEIEEANPEVEKAEPEEAEVEWEPMEPISEETEPETEDEVDADDGAEIESEVDAEGNSPTAEQGILEEVAERIAQEEIEQQASRLKVTKIQRKEMAMLPRSEWRLANNNFLLHGYYNYRHLVLLEDGLTLKLGVPGVFHEKEAKAAEAFGFPEFIPAEEAKVSLEPEECNEQEPFGYWCRPVRQPVTASW